MLTPPLHAQDHRQSTNQLLTGGWVNACFSVATKQHRATCPTQACTHMGPRWTWVLPPSAPCVWTFGWCTAECCKRQTTWTGRDSSAETQSDCTGTHTCPRLGSHHCSVHLSTCPRTQRLWAACTDRTLLRSWGHRKQQESVVHAVSQAQICFPLTPFGRAGSWPDGSGLRPECWSLSEASGTKPQNRIIPRATKWDTSERAEVTHCLQQPWVVRFWEYSCWREDGQDHARASMTGLHAGGYSFTGSLMSPVYESEQ